MRLNRLSIGALLLVCAAGCNLYDLCDDIDGFKISMRNRCYADKAWHRCFGLYSDVDHPLAFRDGFLDGYTAVASGGNGCAPTLPPRKYWKPYYQTPQGHCKTLAWFDGYAHGAVAAQQDGIANWNRIPTSGMANCFPIPDSGNGPYPLDPAALTPPGPGVLPPPAPATAPSLTPPVVIPIEPPAEPLPVPGTSAASAARPAGSPTFGPTGMPVLIPTRGTSRSLSKAPSFNP